MVLLIVVALQNSVDQTISTSTKYQYESEPTLMVAGFYIFQLQTLFGFRHRLESNNSAAKKASQVKQEAIERSSHVNDCYYAYRTEATELELIINPQIQSSTSKIAQNKTATYE